MNQHKKVIFIVGPTAIGKSSIALPLVKSLHGEIISCDSMKIYKEITVANNKPTKQELKGIKHHLVGIISAERKFDVGQFNELAIKRIKDIHKRNRVPIVVGGSGLYMQILLDGIFESGRKNDPLRTQLKSFASQNTESSLHDLLADKDPQAASKIHPHDLKRIIRALEVCITEKKPISKLQKKRSGLWGQYDLSIIGLTQDREKLYYRINQRVDDMFDDGLVEEIKKLSKLKLSDTADRIIGNKEVRNYLDGNCDLDHARAQMKRNTRRLAKRQMTWFRKEKRIHWINIEGKSANKIIKEIKAYL